MDHNIAFTPAFHHGFWTDGVDRVTAGGDNGFNARFALLEADLASLSARIADINAALNADRETTRTGLSVFRDGVVRQDDAESVHPDFGFQVLPVAANDFMFFGGSVLVNGHFARLEPKGDTDEDQYRYSTQPWTDPARAAADGVPVIPPLTTPNAARTDLVYLDTWEHETVVNGVRRTVREIALRVAVGQSATPVAPPGHDHLRLARLPRPAGASQFKDVIDLRRLIRAGRSVHAPVLAPLFHAESFPGYSPWQNMVVGEQIIATKDLTQRTSGMLALDLPPGAHLTGVQIRGSVSTATDGSTLNLSLIRVSPLAATPSAKVLNSEVVNGNKSFIVDLTLPDDPSVQRVNGSDYHYVYAWAGGLNSTAEIRSVQPRYEF
jgi:hypothetical protein